MTAPSPVHHPRITIQFCTQCKWMLRAAYFAQELLSTFSLSLGEVALIPSTGGVFTVDIIHQFPSPESSSTSTTEKPGPEQSTQTTRLWDRKTEGGFPEVKQLKKLVRDIIDPGRDLGHVDRHGKAAAPAEERKGGVGEGKRKSIAPEMSATANEGESSQKENPDGSICEDCQ